MRQLHLASALNTSFVCCCPRALLLQCWANISCSMLLTCCFHSSLQNRKQLSLHLHFGRVQILIGPPRAFLEQRSRNNLLCRHSVPSKTLSTSSNLDKTSTSIQLLSLFSRCRFTHSFAWLSRRGLPAKHNPSNKAR